MRDRDVGHRIAPQPLQLLHVLRLGAREFLLAIGQRDPGPAVRQRNGRLERGVAPAHDQRVLGGKVPRIVQTVVDLFQLLARDAKLSEVAASPDGDEHAACLERSAARDADDEPAVARALDSLGAPRGRPDVPLLDLIAQFLDQRLLDVGIYL